MTAMLTLPAITPNARPVSTPELTSSSHTLRAASDGTIEQYWLDDGARLVPVGVITDGQRWYIDTQAVLRALARTAPTLGSDRRVAGRDYHEATALGCALGLDFTRHPQTRSLTADGRLSTAREATAGLTYPLGERWPLGFTLGGAAYSIDRFETGGAIVTPNVDEKLLIVRFTVLNTHRAAQVLAPYTLCFEIGTPTLQPIAPSAVWCTPGGASAHLAPNARVDITAAFVLPAHVHVNHLTVRRSGDGAALQYALEDIVEPLRGAHADRRDPRGATPLCVLPGRPGVLAPLSTLDVRLDGLAPHATAKCASGTRMLAATITVRNARSSAVYLGLSTLRVTLRAPDGRELAQRDVLEGSLDVTVTRTLGAGESAQVRYVFEVPGGWPVGAVGVQEGNSRTMVYATGRV